MLALRERLARKLAAGGWTLRSGHAQGADRAFEVGAGGRAVIYLPSPTFGQRPYRDKRTGEVDPGMKLSGEAVCLPEQWRGHYQTLQLSGIRSMHAGVQEFVRLLHGRNFAQVFGHDEPDFSEPSRFVLCWRPEPEGQPQGGTATAVLLARRQGIEVRNLWDETTRRAAEAWLAE